MNYVRPFDMNRKNVIDSVYVSVTQMFQALNMIVMANPAARMYRSVDNHVNPREAPRGTKRTVASDGYART